MKITDLDPQPYYDRAILELEPVTPEEINAWLNHPCTKSLAIGLEGDLVSALANLLNGEYSNETSIDATAQNQAKVRGMAQAIQDALREIHNMRQRKEGE